MRLSKRLCFVFLFLQLTHLIGQNKQYTHQDTLRGSITPERSWWDVTYYQLNVNVDINKKELKGSNQIQYKVLTPNQILQIELQEPLKITKITQQQEELFFKKDGYSYFVELKEKQWQGSINTITIHYEGAPKVSTQPPWQGGLSWKKDKNGNPWVVTTCQGNGASIWWPNKDHAYDEPDSMRISITIPKGLTAVSNGKLTSITDNKNQTTTFNWLVNNPINNYGVNMNIGNYTNFNEKYKGLKGDLLCNYYVLPDDLNKAKKQFKEVKKMLAAFEYWFGPYPFYEDGYKLVQVPYAGMEHQSSVTYGNGFKNGYYGIDVSHSGWGMKFDYILVHESGHEWFANNLTHIDIADLWIHEGFTTYAENLFLNYHYGETASNEYVIGQRKNILNDRPIIADYQVHQKGSNDMYYKGANILHTLRQVVNNDSLWRAVLIGLNQDFYHQTISTQQIETYISKKTKQNLVPFFNQYLRTTKIPVLEYKIDNATMKYRYTNVVKGFNMPLKVFINTTEKWITPTEVWQEIPIAAKKIKVDKNFYVVVRKN